MTDTPKRLFVWSGGGMTGLDIHAGLAMALAERGIEPDANSGTSAGAVIAAWHSSRPRSASGPAMNLAHIIAGLKDSDVRRERFGWKLRIPWIDSFLENEAILKLLRTWLPGDLNGVEMPLSTWATNALTGALTNTARPELSASIAEAVMASMTIAGVFPRVKLLDGQEYIDGGCRAYLPLPGDFREFDEIYLMVAQTRPEDYRKKHGIITALMTGASWMMFDQVEDTIAQAKRETESLTAESFENGSAKNRSVKIVVLWPELTSETGALRFDHALIQQAYHYALDKLPKPGWM